MMNEKNTILNQSLEKSINIIEAMAAENGSIRLKDLAEKVDIPACTALRIVNTLAKYGYVYQDEATARYGLTLKFAEIGEAVASTLDLRTLIHPYLVRLSGQVHEAACLAVEDNMEVMYIDVVDGPDSILQVAQRIGKRAPMHSTGVGKLMLLEYSPEKLEQLAAKKGLNALTKHTITAKQELIRELQDVRAKGYAMDNEECEIGVRCVAAPIKRFGGKTVAAISISGPIFRMTMDRIRELAPQIQAAAQEISTLLAASE